MGMVRGPLTLGELSDLLCEFFPLCCAGSYVLVPLFDRERFVVSFVMECPTCGITVSEYDLEHARAARPVGERR